MINIVRRRYIIYNTFPPLLPFRQVSIPEDMTEPRRDLELSARVIIMEFTHAPYVSRRVNIWFERFFSLFLFLFLFPCQVPISEDMTRPRRDSELSAWVNIIYGCNERCTYCVVPTTRGVYAYLYIHSLIVCICMISCLYVWYHVCTCIHIHVCMISCLYVSIHTLM